MAQPNGRSDQYFIDRVRRDLRDLPNYYPANIPTDGQNGTVAAGAKPFRLERAPIMPPPRAALNLTAPGFGGTVIVDGPVPPAAGNCTVVSETGEIIFATAPGVGTLSVGYAAIRFSDTQILDALTEGLNLLWPEVWNQDEDSTSIRLGVTQFEYLLPSFFQDSRVVIREIEIAPPSGFIIYYRTSLWRQVFSVSAPKVIMMRIWPPGSVCRITYAQPYQTLGQPSTQEMHLPIYYALAALSAEQELMRNRSDDLPALTGESVAQAGVAASSASWWLQQFYQQLTRLSIDAPTRVSVMDRVVEKLSNRSFGHNFSWAHMR